MIDPKSLDLTDLLVTWYSAPSGRAAPLPDSCAWLPNPLKDWHTLTSRWRRRITFTTSMIPPEKILLPEDGKAIFMTDVTGDWRWCIDPDDPDTVFEAESYEPLERNPERLEEFLVHNTVREIVYGAPVKTRALAVPEEILAKILAPLEEVAFEAWNWPTPGYRIFMSDYALAETIQADSGLGWDVEVVAPKVGQLTHLEDISGAHWRR